MQFSLSAAVMALATLVSAQDLQTGPWTLKVKGTAASTKINGFLGACHAGAGISALCYSAASVGGDSSQFYFNYTTYQKVEGRNTGYVTWNQPYTSSDNTVEYYNQQMGLSYQDNSNVAAVLFGIGTYKYTGWTASNELFGPVYSDDSTNTPVTPPRPSSEGKAVYNWAVCWQYVGGYYYQSVAWIQIGKPNNPTCESVHITRVKATA